MKKILLFITIVIFSFASAQNTTDTFWVKPIEPRPKDYSLQLPKTYLISPPRQLIDKSKLLNTLPNGNKIYALYCSGYVTL
jgi:hypothetical protein